MSIASRSHTLVLVIVAGALGFACKSKQPAAPPSTVDSTKLVIEKAAWTAADGRATLDVTKVVAGLVKDNALVVDATTQVLGDPSAFMLKELRVEWSKGGVVARKFVPEGKTLTISADERPVPIRVVVRKAVYGNLASNKIVDVTQKVDGFLKDNILALTPSNDLFGDPAAGQMKQLRVDYTLDGAAKSKTGNENEVLTISPTSP